MSTAAIAIPPREIGNRSPRHAHNSFDEPMGRARREWATGGVHFPFADGVEHSESAFFSCTP
ncbi:hypothetical protein ACIPM2_05480 [Streptomyces sp. NPDC086081]|uniref:hypothetical protein n=1 Tax=unclassified Streptomyces TaxID=2593676 RepID=UPI0034255F19